LSLPHARVSALPAGPFQHARLVAAYALRGEAERAAAELTEAQRLDGGNTFSSIARLGSVRDLSLTHARMLILLLVLRSALERLCIRP